MESNMMSCEQKQGAEETERDSCCCQREGEEKKDSPNISINSIYNDTKIVTYSIM
jgi:hypothetical protein